MRDQFDLNREMSVACRDRHGAWAFVRSFVEHWSTGLDTASGCGSQELADAERRLGVRLPAAVREAYLLFGRRPDLTSRQDTLLSPDRLRLDDTGRMLVFRVENPSVAEWGIAVADLGMPDPPVLFRLDAPAGRREQWRPYLDRFSLACLEIVLSEHMLGGRGHHDNREADAMALNVLESRYQRLAFPDHPLWAAPDSPPIRWFTGPDVLIREDARDWIWVAARTFEALRAVYEAVPGDWLIAPEPPVAPDSLG